MDELAERLSSLLNASINFEELNLPCCRFGREDTSGIASSPVDHDEGRRLTRENRSRYLLLVSEMDQTADSTHGKNKGKSAADMTSSEIEFPSSESQVQAHEVAELNNFIGNKIDKMLLSNLEALFEKAISLMVESGYSKDETEKALSRNGLYKGEGDPVSNIVNDTLNILKGKQVTSPTDIAFENFQEFLNYTMVEIIRVFQELKFSLTVGEAMWLLFVCDFNLSQAYTMEAYLSGLRISEGESSASISDPRSKPKAYYAFPLNYAAKSTSALVDIQTSTSNKKSNPKTGPTTSNTPKISDHCTLAGIPYDKTLSKYVPRDEKDDLFLKLVPRVKELQDELQGWTDWVNQKVMQVAQRLMKDQTELRNLRKEKQEAELFEKEIQKMESVVANHSFQIECYSSTSCILESENAKLKKELSTVKALAVKEEAKLQQALQREQMALKKAQLWKSKNDNGLLLHELQKEKSKLANLQQEVQKEKMLQAKVEARLERERAAKEELLAQAALIRKEREKIEACSKSQEDIMRKKAVAGMEDYVEKFAKLEKELFEVKSKCESGRIAALCGNVDENKSTQEVKGNKKSIASQIIATCEASGSLKRERECVMCLSEEMSVVFLPCAHQVLCVECNNLHEKQGLTECPTCRTPIQRRIHSRFSVM